MTVIRLPRLHDPPDKIIVDPGPDDNDGGGGTILQFVLLRPPAMPEINKHKFPVTIGFLDGAPTDQIAHSLAIGEVWLIGPAPYAPCGPGGDAIWLSPIDLPYRDQVAAWRPRGPF